ncbi:MAG: DMT family protein [Planctomycetia bacterium]|nr:MAG: DMT family protein [Planctomycetia bacterium]
MSPAIQTILLLIGSNVFMIAAWYGHLKFAPPSWSPLLIIAVAWMIALPEYILQVPANRIGSNYFGGPFSTAQLKIIQEVINIVIFTGFTVFVLKDKLRTTDYIALALIVAAVAVSSLGGRFGGRH